jgi:hypothetical protein
MFEQLQNMPQPGKCNRPLGEALPPLSFQPPSEDIGKLIFADLFGGTKGHRLQYELPVRAGGCTTWRDMD